MELDDLSPLVGAAADTTLLEAAVLNSGAPLILRIGREPERDLTLGAAAALARCPTVTVVVGSPDEVPAELSAAADICLTNVVDPPAPWVRYDADAVVEATAARPEAALALVSLLRVSDGLPTWQGVAAEASTYAALLGGSAFARWLVVRGRATHRANDEPAVVIDRDGDRLDIVLNRPQVHNAVDRALRDELVAAFELAAADDTIDTIELNGRGPSFSAGGDLAEFGTVDDGGVALAIRLTRHPGLAVAAVADRVTARLHGACIGAGIEIPAFARHVVADPNTVIQLPELSMGLVPGAGGTVSLPRRIGRQRTAFLALTGLAIDAALAHRWGLVDVVAPVRY